MTLLLALVSVVFGIGLIWALIAYKEDEGKSPPVTVDPLLDPFPRLFMGANLDAIAPFTPAEVAVPQTSLADATAPAEATPAGTLPEVTVQEPLPDLAFALADALPLPPPEPELLAAELNPNR